MNSTKKSGFAERDSGIFVEMAIFIHVTHCWGQMQVILPNFGCGLSSIAVSRFLKEVAEVEYITQLLE